MDLLWKILWGREKMDNFGDWWCGMCVGRLAIRRTLSNQMALSFWQPEPFWMRCRKGSEKFKEVVFAVFVYCTIQDTYHELILTSHRETTLRCWDKKSSMVDVIRFIKEHTFPYIFNIFSCRLKNQSRQSRLSFLRTDPLLRKYQIHSFLLHWTIWLSWWCRWLMWRMWNQSVFNRSLDSFRNYLPRVFPLDHLFGPRYICTTAPDLWYGVEVQTVNGYVPQHNEVHKIAWSKFFRFAWHHDPNWTVLHWLVVN